MCRVSSRRMAKVVRYGLMGVGGVVLAASLVSSLTACPFPTAGIFDAYMSIDGQRRQNEFTTDTKNIQCTAVVNAAATRPTTVEMLIRQEQALNYITGGPDPAAGTPVLVYADFTGSGTQTLALKPVEEDAGANGGGGEAVPFPAGRFHCEIYLDGKPAEDLAFNVNFAPCPPQIIEPGAKCEGYYRANQVCPRGGFGIPGANRPGQFAGNCTCAGGPGSVWVCQ